MWLQTTNRNLRFARRRPGNLDCKNQSWLSLRIKKFQATNKGNARAEKACKLRQRKARIWLSLVASTPPAMRNQLESRWSAYRRWRTKVAPTIWQHSISMSHKRLGQIWQLPASCCFHSQKLVKSLLEFNSTTFYHRKVHRLSAS